VRLVVLGLAAGITRSRYLTKFGVRVGDAAVGASLADVDVEPASDQIGGRVGDDLGHEAGELFVSR